jgi:hypothetical protein
MNQPYHCHACGNVMCASCASNTAIVTELEEAGEVHVCDLCYYGQVSFFLNIKKIFSNLLHFFNLLGIC